MSASMFICLARACIPSLLNSIQVERPLRKEERSQGLIGELLSCVERGDGRAHERARPGARVQFQCQIEW
jgi:hypothetical protein